MEGFELHERLGAGPRSQVYRATHLASGHEVALKVSGHPGQLRREAKCLTSLDDPGIAALIDEGADWIAVDLVAGPSLQKMFDGGEEG